MNTNDKSIILYALQSKKSGRFFEFEQYCDDGYGMYEDSVSWPFRSGQPKYFTEFELFGTEQRHSWIWSSLKDHTPKEVKVVKFRLIMI